MKFRKMSVPFPPQPGISAIFGRMESALVKRIGELTQRDTPCISRTFQLRMR